MTAVLSHRGHLSGTLKTVTKAQDIARAFDALDQMKTLEGKCLTLLQVAEGAGELRIVFSSIDQIRRNLEMLMELTTQLDKELKALI